LHVQRRAYHKPAVFLMLSPEAQFGLLAWNGVKNLRHQDSFCFE